MDTIDYEAEILKLEERNEYLKKEYDWLFEEYKNLRVTAKAMVEQVDILMKQINSKMVAK